MPALDQLHAYLRPRLTAWKDRLPTTLMHTAYTGMAAGVLWPLVAAMQGGQWDIAMALGQLLGNVGANLLSDHIKTWKDEASAAQAIDTAPADLRADLDKVLAALEAPRLATEALSTADRAWFERTLKDNLQTLGNRTVYEQTGALNVFLQAGASMSHSNVAVNQTINNTTIIHPPPAPPPSRREAYLQAVLAGEYRILPLQALDTSLRAKGVAVQMSEVYVPLLTLTPEEHDQWTRGERNLDRGTRRLSALEQLDKHQRLLLLGDPGFGKSTFVNLLTLCLAGEARKDKDPDFNHTKLTAPVPHQDLEKAQPQTWSHGALLPVRVVLRELAATLPANGASADLLWQFVVRQLQALMLEDFAPELRQHLQDVGGLILLDGLDEVPHADRRRKQLIDIVHCVAQAFPRAGCW